MADSNYKAKNNKTKPKKIDITHTISFNYAPSQLPASPYDDYYKRQKIIREQKMQNRFSKEQYVLANFHFVVRPPSQVNNANSSFYHLTMQDPDLLVEWSSIELVEYVQTSTVDCPICLEAPCAAKITKCGHVFCYRCVIQCFQATPIDKGAPKCPICNSRIELNQLKSVHIITATDHKEGQHVQFDLLLRPKGSIVSFRKANTSMPLCTIYPVDTETDAKLTRYNVTYDITPLLNRELLELKTQLEVDKGMLSEQELLCAQIAEQQIIERAQEWDKWSKVHLINGPPKKTTSQMQEQESQRMAIHSKFVEQQQNQSIQAQLNAAKNPQVEQLEAEDFDDEEEEDGEPVSKPQPEPDTTSPKTKLPKHIVVNKDTPYYHCYQVQDNQMIFLHPLNIRMLLMEYNGNYELFPTTIAGTILEVNRFQMTEYTRKQHSFLNHVPVGADICFLECDIGHLLSKETFNQFYKEINARHGARQAKQRKQKKEEAQQLAKENEERQKRFAELEQRKKNLSEESFPDTLLVAVASSPKAQDNFPVLANNNNNKKQQQQQATQAATWKKDDLRTKLHQTEEERIYEQIWGEAALPTPTQAHEQNLQGAWAKKSTTTTTTTSVKQQEKKHNNKQSKPAKKGRGTLLWSSSAGGN